MSNSVVKTKTRKMYRTPSGRLMKMSPLALAKQEAAREKQQQALELRKAGATYLEIANSLGYADPSGAKKAVDVALSRVQVENAKEVILLDLQRLDELQMRCMAQLRNKNDLNQVDRILRIMQQRYALAGIGETTAQEIREAMGITQQITNNNTALVINMNPNSEESYIRKMMAAAGASSETIEQYVEEKLAPPPAIEPGKGKKKKVVRRTKKGSNKGGSIEGVSKEAIAVGRLMGVEDGDTTIEDLKYKDSIATTHVPNTVHRVIGEEDIVEGEVIE